MDSVISLPKETLGIIALLLVLITSTLIFILRPELYLSLYVITFSAVLLFTIYFVKFSSLILRREVLIGILFIVLIAISFIGSLNSFGIKAGYSSEQYVGRYLNPKPNTYPILEYFSTIIRNDDINATPPLLYICPSLIDPINSTFHDIIALLILENRSHYLHNQFLTYLSEGNFQLSIQVGRELIATYNEFAPIFLNTRYNLEYLREYSTVNGYYDVLYKIDKINATVSSYVHDAQTYYELIKDISNYSTYKVQLEIHFPDKIPVRQNITLVGQVYSKIGHNETGKVIIEYLNYTETVPVKEGLFTFELYVPIYVTHLTVRIFYTGSPPYLPNFTKFQVRTDVIVTKFNVSLINRTAPITGSLDIVGSVSGANRTLLIKIFNYSRSYVVAGNFSVRFPLPYNLSNSSYPVNFYVLSQGSYSPANTTLYFRPILLSTNVSTTISKYWVIPLPLVVSGTVSGENLSLNGVKVFIFVGNQRFEGTITNGHFRVIIPPKLTTLYGKQIIYIKTDPQYYYYSQTYEGSTLIINPLIYIFIILISSLLLFRAKKNKSDERKSSELIEGKIVRGRVDE